MPKYCHSCDYFCPINETAGAEAEKGHGMSAPSASRTPDTKSEGDWLASTRFC